MELADERTETYFILVTYFMHVKGMSRDDAHREVDAIVKYVDLNLVG